MSCSESRTVTNSTGTLLRHVGAQPLQHLGARHVGHLPVENEQVEAFAAGLLHHFAPADVAVHVVPVLGQPALEQRQLVRIVF